MKKKLILALFVVVALGGGFLWWFFTKKIDDEISVTLPPNIQWLDVGLTREEQLIWHHASEGSELVPYSFLRALQSPLTGKSFLESLDEYGFMFTTTDMSELPVGWSEEHRMIGNRDVPFVGINCSACHSGEIRYNNQTLRIDGAPNLFALEDFFIDLRKAFAELQENKIEAFKFLRRVVRLHHDHATPDELLEISPETLELLEAVDLDDGVSESERALAEKVGEGFGQVLDTADSPPTEDPSFVAEPGDSEEEKAAAKSLREVFATLHKYEKYLERRIETMKILAHAIDSGTDLGPGRGDSFGIIRDLLYPEDQIGLDAPVSTPDLFHYHDFNFIHWDGNTDTVMERNIAQAIALGADYDKSTGKSSVNAHNLFKLESVAAKIQKPKWPEDVLGKIDRDKAFRGEEHFKRLCTGCHSSEKVFPLHEVGTSPLRAENFDKQVANRPLHQRLDNIASRAKFILYQDRGITPLMARKVEREEEGVWRVTRGYIARPLDGAWATPPFLHNGSVASIHELLLPAEQRRKKFAVGHREYDPLRIGFTIDSTKTENIFLLDTTLPGNSNAGHEGPRFGTTLSEEEKWELIEYIKTL